MPLTRAPQAAGDPYRGFMQSAMLSEGKQNVPRFPELEGTFKSINALEKSETISRTVTEDVEYGGAKFTKGDKVVLWYLSANRDEDVFPDGERLQIDRPNARDQLAFGTGIHFCMGAHLGRLQLQVLWEEIMKRFSQIEVTGEPTRVRSNFVRGYSRLPVRLHAA